MIVTSDRIHQLEPAQRSRVAVDQQLPPVSMVRTTGADHGVMWTALSENGKCL